MKEITPRRYFCLFLLAAGGILALVGTLNALVDPYGNLGLNRVGVFISAERDYKPVQIGRYPHDALILGNSLAGGTDPDQIRSPHRFFNASFPGGRPEEIRCFVERYARDEKVAILGLDFGMAGMYQDVDFDNPLPDSFRYRVLERIFNLKTAEYSIATLNRAWKKDEPGFKENGVAWNEVLKRLKRDREMDGYDYGSLMEQVKARHEQFVYDPRRVDELRRLKKILDDRHIRCIAFINPMHEEIMAQLKESPAYPLYLRWLQEMREIFPDVVEFPEGKYMGRECYYRFDAGHYKPDVAHAMIQEVLERAGDRSAKPSN